MIEIFILLLGLIGLYFGADAVVEGARKIALELKVSQTLLGLTIISIGTSIPEIMTNLFSGWKVSRGIEASGIAVGTNIGSDVTQITFILGVTALLGTLYITKRDLVRDGKMILFSIILVFIVGFTDGKVTVLEGIVLLVIYAFYLGKLAKDEKVLRKVIKNHKNHKNHFDIFKNGAKLTLGLIILIIASKYVVESALTLSELWGVSQSFIGIMIVGIGTALPELSTALKGIMKGAHEISIGTILGSNITDPMLSLPLGAIATSSIGLTFDKNLLWFDMPFWFIVSIIALFLLGRNLKIGKQEKKEGYILIALYLVFVFIKITYFMR